ncbi:AraC family transcriptional regulator [Paenibacillus sp. Marseille-Q4541]|uniref:AraC family transcriptional regulator n=1 Tax=Paenibacillus sp. Marseille-Q4541 TaxID=2831522 RepID=UPI001BABAB58
MNQDHTYFEVGINPHPEENEPAVLFCGEGRPDPSHRIGPSVHEYYLVHTVLDGKGVFQSGGVSYPCEKGDTFFIFPGVLFSYEADSTCPWHYTWVALKGDAVSSYLRRIGISEERPVLHTKEPSAAHELYRRIRTSFGQTAYPAMESLEASGWMRLLFHHFGLANLDSVPIPQSEHPVMIDRQVEHAIRWISLQYPQQISIHHMASTLGYHRAHLSKSFKIKTGLSPKQYLMKVRLEKAKELLSDNLTIDQISSSVGFNDALYFSKQFRKEYRMSPTEYRNEIAKKS